MLPQPWGIGRVLKRKHVHPAYQHYTDAGRNGSVCSYIQLIQIGVLTAHLSERVPLLTWVQFPLGTTYDSYVKRVSQRSAESRGFSPGTPVSSHRECLTGWVGLTLTGPSIVAVLHDGEQ